jgi:hypothetical protein
MNGKMTGDTWKGKRVMALNVKRFVCHVALDTTADAAKAVRILRKL